MKPKYVQRFLFSILFRNFRHFYYLLALLGILKSTFYRMFKNLKAKAKKSFESKKDPLKKSLILKFSF